MVDADCLRRRKIHRQENERTDDIQNCVCIQGCILTFEFLQSYDLCSHAMIPVVQVSQLSSFD